MNCPNCGAENQTGKFCAKCGAGLDVTCDNCGATAAAGAKFCTSCGEALGAAAGAGGGGSGGSGSDTGPTAGAAAGGGGGSNTAAWIIAAASVIIAGVLVVVFLPDSTRTTAPASTNAPFMGGSGGGAGGGPGMGGLSSDMRTNADRLFNRIMIAAQEGNEAEVAQFMPMAIQAYGMVEGLDGDGHYHLGMLHLTNGSYDEALSTAREVLAEQPQHLLALAVAAEAAAGAGDTAQANEYWQAYLDAYDSEASQPMPEYVDHQPMLPTYRDMAREALGQ